MSVAEVPRTLSSRNIGFFSSFAIGVFLLAGHGAFAQTPEATPAQTPAAAQESGIISYPVSFFDDIRPSSALDMVQRLPGFTYSRGEGTVRGFAGSGGNVLIDGAPPTSKSVRLDDVLRRIPTDNVERIELIRGGAPGIDMQGQSVIANVVRKGGVATTASAQQDVKIYPAIGKFGSVSRADFALRTDNWSIEANALARLDRNGMRGAGSGNIVRLDGAGLLRNSGPYEADYYRRNYQAGAILEFRWPDDLLHINFGLDMDKQTKKDIADVTTPLNVTTHEQTNSIQNTDQYELGSDYETTLFGLDTRLLALQRFVFSRTYSSSATRFSGQDSPSGESIFRATFGASPFPWLTWETGTEAAFNFLDAKSSLIVGGVPQVVPNANVRVEEKRGELFGTANFTFWPGFRLETGLRWEWSTISQTGDTNQEKSFAFPKPRAILTYDVTPTTQFRARVEREVGQLDFNSFASANDPSLGIVTAGNANLEPERSWVYEAALEQRFWGKGAVVFTYTHYNVEAVNDQIPVVTTSGTFDAPGNIGDGTKDEFKLTLSLPLQNIGWPDATIRMDNTVRLSSVTDPFTFQKRRISGEIPIMSVWTFTQDFPQWNSTLTIENTWESSRRTFRIRENRLEGQDPQLRFTWDWKYQPDVLVRFILQDVVPRMRKRDRILYTGSRATGTIASSENLEVQYDPFVFISVRKTF